MRVEHNQTVTRGHVAEQRQMHPGPLSPDTKATVDSSDREHSVLPVLWQPQISRYVEKVRWALDYKRVPHIRQSLLPGLHLFKPRHDR